MYTVSECNDNKGVWYAHRFGFSQIPLFGSFGTKLEAEKIACAYSNCTWKERSYWRKKLIELKAKGA